MDDDAAEAEQLDELATALGTSEPKLSHGVVVKDDSLAFALPVSTPPNAMAFASGRLQVIDMMKAGLLLNVLGVVAIFVVLATTGAAIFELDSVPDWAAAEWEQEHMAS